MACRSVLSVVACVALGACGARTSLERGEQEQSASPPDVVDASSLPPIDAGVPTIVDGGVSDASPVEESPPPPSLGKYGFLLAYVAGQRFIGEAVIAPVPIPPTCAFIGQNGSCAVATCPETSLDVGAIAESVGPATNTLTYVGMSPSGAYPEANTQWNGVPLGHAPALFHGAGGSGVPAFDLATTMPAMAAIGVPTPWANPTLSTSQDLSFTWTPFSDADAFLLIAAPNLSAPTSESMIACFENGTAGQALVPSADLAALKALVGNLAVVEFFAVSRASFDVGNGWTLNELAMQADPTLHSIGQVTLE